MAELLQIQLALIAIVANSNLYQLYARNPAIKMLTHFLQERFTCIKNIYSVQLMTI